MQLKIVWTGYHPSKTFCEHTTINPASMLEIEVRLGRLAMMGFAPKIVKIYLDDELVCDVDTDEDCPDYVNQWVDQFQLMVAESNKPLDK